MLQPLTSFRFFAALLVFFWHFNILKHYQTGYIGVSFFFVLSGFILTYSYHTKFKSLNKINVSSFFVARIAKIYPVHLLTWFISLPAFALHGISSDRIIGGLLSLFLLQSYVPIGKYNFGFNGVSWSISDEMFFYTLFPIILFTLLKIFNSSNVLKLFSFMLVIWLTSVVLMSYHHAPYGDDWFSYVFPVVRIFDFLIGICVGLAFIRFKKRPSEGQQRNQLIKFSIFELISILLLTSAIIYSPHISQSLRFSLYYLPFWALLIYIFAFQSGVVSKLMSNKILVYLGEISFSFYMIHQLVLKYLIALHIPYLSILGFIISLGLSALMFKFYEEPIRKKIRNFFMSHPNKGQSVDGINTIASVPLAK